MDYTAGFSLAGIKGAERVIDPLDLWTGTLQPVAQVVEPVLFGDIDSGGDACLEFRPQEDG